MPNRALLVGINNYPVLPLQGCIHDIDDIEVLLCEYFDFRPSDIRRLANAEATAAGIREALQSWLIADALPGDRLVFHFSGHGSFLDFNEVVHDIICPVDYDFLRPRQECALSNTDFEAIFSGLPAGVSFVWISDSCNSGDLARDGRGAKAFPPGILPRFLPPPPDVLERIEVILATHPERTRSLLALPEGLRGVMLAACQSDETSCDAIINGRANGAFTYHLVQQLRITDGPKRGIVGLIENIAAAIEGPPYNQHPQVRGSISLHDKPFLSPYSQSATDAAAASMGPAPAASSAPSISASPPSAAVARAAPRRGRSGHGKRIALVIGNAAYRSVGSGPLANPVNDAALITRTLDALDFDHIFGGAGADKGGKPRPGFDLGKSAFDKLADEFADALAPGDTALIYYAGHGLQVGDRNYLVPVDATLESSSPLAELVELNRLVGNAVRQTGKDGRVIVLLDACRDDPFSKDQVSALFKAIEAQLGEAEAKRARIASGLGSWPLQQFDAPQFIAYATAPGETASDGRPGHGNGPFAEALAKHMAVRGLEINEFFNRVGRDVQSQVSPLGRVQDPWMTTNLKVPFYFNRMSWWPMLILGILGAMIGLVTSHLVVDARGPALMITNPWENPWRWLVGFAFAPVVVAGTILWGSAGRWSWRSVRDLVFAIAGCGLAFALALVILQLVKLTGSEAWHPQADPSYEKVFTALSVFAGVLTLIGTWICWDWKRPVWRSVLNLALAPLLVYALWSLQQRILHSSESISPGTILLALVAGVLFAGGTALACKPQSGMFGGFGAVTGAMAIGLLLPAFFDLYAWASQTMPPEGSAAVAYALGTLWFGLLGAQLGYCFARFVPEYEPLSQPAATLPPDKRPRRDLVFPATRGLSSATNEEENDYHPELFERADRDARGPDRGGVAWAKPDRLSPCYSHLLPDGTDNLALEKSFTVGKAELALLSEANRYNPLAADIVVFGLRGARLHGKESLEGVDRLELMDSRPDHKTFQCVIGYMERTSGKLWAYTGSTVPWHGYMSAGKKYNLLPTGCYIYKKGTHRPTNPDHWVTPALRLSDADGAESGKATVLRTARKLVFDTSGDWDFAEPSDNIHCAYSLTSFSSLGCQTIKGGKEDGLWPRFQARLKSLPDHARVDYLLFTGAECAIAAGLILAGKSASDAEVAKRLGRLRVGSEGDEVKRLQARLQVDQTGYFGASTKKTLTTIQRSNGITVDGIYTPAMDVKLGWGVFQGETPPPPAQPRAISVEHRRAEAAAPPAQASPHEVPSASAQSKASGMVLTPEQLRQIAPRPKDPNKGVLWDKYSAALTSADGDKVLDEYAVSKSPQRLAFILANMLAETGGLSLIWESMAYSADRLVAIFGSAANISGEEARRLAYKQQDIAERVYGLGNPRKAKELGNSQPGDGWRYRGGGFLQTTGRENYRTLGQRIGVDLEGHPELIEDPLISLRAACAEWDRAGLNDYADRGEFRACCNGINYGNPKHAGNPIGYDDRLHYLQRAGKSLAVPLSGLAGTRDLTRDPERSLELGDIGPDVEALQFKLNTLGYDAGEADGAFTSRTRDAILVFQAHNDLPTTGRADQATVEALNKSEAKERGAW